MPEYRRQSEYENELSLIQISELITQSSVFLIALRLEIKKCFIFHLLKHTGAERFSRLLKTVLKYRDGVCWIYSTIKQVSVSFQRERKIKIGHKTRPFVMNLSHRSLNHINGSVIRSERLSNHWITESHHCFHLQISINVGIRIPGSSSLTQTKSIKTFLGLEIK